MDPKSSKKNIEKSGSYEKAPSESKSAKKSLVQEFEGSETELNRFMT